MVHFYTFRGKWCHLFDRKSHSGHLRHDYLIKYAYFLPIRTHLGRWITFLFFSYRDLRFWENFTSASNLCALKKGAFVLMLFKARYRLQTKTKHYNMIFFILSQVRFVSLGRQFIIWVSNKDKGIDELKSHRRENTAKIFFGWIFTLRLIQSSRINTAQRLYKKS